MTDLDKNAMNELLSKLRVGHLATVDSEGKPYVVPVGYNYWEGAIYLHVSERATYRGRPMDSIGKKIENISRNPNVCFEVTLMEPATSWLRAKRWGGGASVVAMGKAEKVMDDTEKTKVFGEISRRGAVYKIKPEAMTGKSFTMRLARKRAKKIKEYV